MSTHGCGRPLLLALLVGLSCRTQLQLIVARVVLACLCSVQQLAFYPRTSVHSAQRELSALLHVRLNVEHETVSPVPPGPAMLFAFRGHDPTTMRPLLLVPTKADVWCDKC